MKELTENQATVLNAIKEHLREYHSFPAFFELSRTLGVYPNAVWESCRALETKGYLETYQIAGKKKRKYRLLGVDIIIRGKQQ